jgi:quercetin dioxygenase-like cupin family protein
MRRTRLSGVQPVPADPDHFTGSARRHDLIAVDDPPSSAILVAFEPGARTHWHRHPAGQYLYVVDGLGLTQRRGGEVEELAPGDCLYAAPGEEHWHGAGRVTGVSHLAFSFGVTEWVGPAELETEEAER